MPIIIQSHHQLIAFATLLPITNQPNHLLSDHYPRSIKSTAPLSKHKQTNKHTTRPINQSINQNARCRKILPPHLCRLHGLWNHIHHHRRIKRRRSRRRRTNTMAKPARQGPICSERRRYGTPATRCLV